MPKLVKRLAALGPLPAGREWLVMVPNGWSRKPDLATAAREACRYGTGGGTPGRGPMIVLHVHPESTVTPMGDVEYPLGEGNQTVEVARFENRR